MAEDEDVIVSYRTESRKTVNTSVSLYEGDWDLLAYIEAYLGCSRSEAIRSAVRAFATHLATIDPARKR